MLSDAVDPASLARALVIKLRHHGDVLLASPVLTTLKAHAPHVEIDALVYDDTAAMLARHPALAELHTVGRAWRALGPPARLREELRLLRRLRARRYDLIVHLTDHPRGAWLARLLARRAAVAPARASKWWRGSFTHTFPVVGGNRRHTVETHLDALRRIGMQPAQETRRLVLAPGAAAVAAADALLAEHGLAPRGFVHVHPASRWRFKCWTADGFARVIDAAAARGLRAVVTAAPSPAERAIVDAVIARAKHPPVDLAGRLTLEQLAALTSRARAFVGVDSAPMHMAAAMGTPVVALFGPSGDIEWAPWRVPARVIVAEEFTCRPCGYDGCGGGKLSECLTAIDAARVVGALDELLAATA